MRTALAIAIALLATPVLAHDPHGDHGYPPEIMQWFQTLKNMRGTTCCNGLDSIEPKGWRFGGAGYQVMLDDGQWLDVPDWAMVQQRNILNRAQVWPYLENGETKVRCFLPGAGG